jgi:biopolymer transport protein ExbB
MTFSYLEIWQHMGAPAIAIAVVLLTMGLASLTVFLERLFTLRRSRAVSKAFAGTIADKMRSADVDGILADAQSEEYARGHLTRVVRSGLTMYVHARQTADISGMSSSERTRRHLERYLEEVGEDLRRGMSVLASVGSVAPFVGLLGTVVGIISAFQGIASSGSGGLSSVSAGISEALIETALGLAVAIPAVLAFNFLSTQIAHDEGRLQRSAGELLDMIEDWEERSVQSEGMRRGRVA